MEVWREYPELSGKDLLIPRYVVPIDAVDGTKVDFLVFSDAAEYGGGIAVYARYLRTIGTYSCKLFCSRS